MVKKYVTAKYTGWIDFDYDYHYKGRNFTNVFMKEFNRFMERSSKKLSKKLGSKVSLLAGIRSTGGKEPQTMPIMKFWLRITHKENEDIKEIAKLAEKIMMELKISSKKSPMMSNITKIKLISREEKDIEKESTLIGTRYYFMTLPKELGCDSEIKPSIICTTRATSMILAMQNFLMEEKCAMKLFDLYHSFMDGKLDPIDDVNFSRITKKYYRKLVKRGILSKKSTNDDLDTIDISTMLLTKYGAQGVYEKLKKSCRKGKKCRAIITHSTFLEILVSLGLIDFARDSVKRAFDRECKHLTF